MSQSEQRLRFDGAVVSYASNMTPHYIGQFGPPQETAVNADYALYQPEVGVVVGDGVGKGRYAPWASELVVKRVIRRALEVRLSEVPIDEVEELMHSDVLPHVDEALGRSKNSYKDQKEFEGIENASAAVGGLLLARNNHLVAFAAGDVLVQLLARRMSKETGVLEEKFLDLTVEQCSENELHNTFNGTGRPNRNELYSVGGVTLPPQMTHDQVFVFPAQAGDRGMVSTDGFGGDRPHQRPPRNIVADNLFLDPNATAEQVAHRLAQIPNLCDQLNMRVPVIKDGQEGHYYFSPKLDDMALGVLSARDA